MPRIFLTSTVALAHWTVPADWTEENTIECIGGGGGGSNSLPAGGGGGGAYAAITNFPAVAGNVITYQIGTGGGGNGGDTWFDGASFGASSVGAKGGLQGGSPAGGAGGTAASSRGTTKHSGGDGGTAIGSALFIGASGGGGAAGPLGDGGDGASNSTSQGGGGGGNGGGSNASTINGGNNFAGTGGGIGGSSGTAGTNGGGGGAGTVGPGAGAAGGAGTEWTSKGSGGGSGGSPLNGNASGNGGLYGGGGSATCFGPGLGPPPTQGAQGLIVITYVSACTCSDTPDLPNIEAWYVVNEPLIGFTDRSSYLFLGENAQHTLNLQTRQRGTASYTLRMLSGDNYLPTRGTPVYLYDHNASGFTLAFAGLIQDFTQRWVGVDGLRFVDVNAVTLDAIFDTVYATTPLLYQDKTTGFIVADLLCRFECGSQVAAGTIDDGETISRFNVNLGDKLDGLFDQLATTSGFIWYVDIDTQTLQFHAPDAVAAPFTINSVKALWDTISDKLDGADYRNRQGVKLGYNAFAHSCEFFVGSGQQDFTLARPVDQVTNAWATLSTCNTATGTFTGQPAAGDTVTIAIPSGAGFGWQASHAYALDGVIVVDGFVQKVTTAGTTGSTQPTFATVTGDTTIDGTAIWTCEGPSGLATGDQTYTFRSTIDNTLFGEVLIGATDADTAQNLVDAINATDMRDGGQLRGVTFSLPTWENSLCNAIDLSGPVFTLQQKHAGTGWLAALSWTGADFSFDSDVTFGGTSPQGSLGPNEGATISLQVYVRGTSVAAPGLDYIPGSDQIHLATPLNAGSNLNVEYTRADGNVIQVERTDLVLADADITHGTGKVQQMTDQSQTGLIATSAAAGLQFAQEALAGYDVPPNELSVQLHQPGLRAGQLLTLSLDSPLDTLNGGYFIEEMQAELVPTYPYLDNPHAIGAGHYRYTARIISVANIHSWLDFWKDNLGVSAGGSSVGGAGVPTSGGGLAPQPGSSTALQVGGTDIATENILDLIAGTNVTITGADDPTNMRVKATIDAPTMVGDSGSGGTAGAVPAAPAGSAAAGKFLKADGTFAVPSGGAGTVTHTGALTAGLPVIGNGAADITVGTRSGNTTEFATISGSLTNGHAIVADASGNLVDSGAAPGTGTVTHTGGALTAHLLAVGNGGADIETPVPIGSAGQYLRSGGAGTDPAFASIAGTEVAAATSSVRGTVTPDGTIITVAAGAITVPKASSSVFGVVEVDGTSITASAGVISAAGSPPTGSAGGSLAGTYPNPTIASSVSLPGSPTTTTQSQGDSSTKLATTAYTDTAVTNAIAGVNPAVAVQAATTGVLPAVTYNNGASGVGATLTENSAAALTVDGYTPAVGDRLLIKNQASALQNGVYLMTTLGTGLIPFVLTRALDYDTPSDINNTGAIPVVNGTVNGITQWVITSHVATVGTDALTFTQFTVNPATILINPMTTKGDVIVGATSGVPARLAVGTNGQVPMANSAATNGIDWEAPISLTTTGTSGAASFTPGNPSVLNIPQYAAGGGGSGALVQLAQTVLSGNAANFTFSSISAGYTDLIIVICARTDEAAVSSNVYVQFNGDTAANYLRCLFSTLGNSVVGAAAKAPYIAFPGASSSANVASTCSVTLNNYARTTFFKEGLAEFRLWQGNTTTGMSVGQNGIFWLSTAAINSVLIAPSTAGKNFIAGSVATLYGRL